MTEPLVYLAGPIANKNYVAAVSWRKHAERRLRLYGATSLSPMRQKDDLMQASGPISKSFRAYADLGPFYTSRGIMARDSTDVRRCDALLVNLLGTPALSAGTVMELGWAYTLQKPVVVCIEAEGNPHDEHPMVHEAIGGLRFPDIDDAIHGVAVVLGLA